MTRYKIAEQAKARVSWNVLESGLLLTCLGFEAKKEVRAQEAAGSRIKNNNYHKEESFCTTLFTEIS